MNNDCVKSLGNPGLLVAAMLACVSSDPSIAEPVQEPLSVSTLVADVLREEKDIEDRLQAFEAIVQLPPDERSAALWQVMEQATDGIEVRAAWNLIRIAQPADDARLAEWSRSLSADKRWSIVGEIAVRALVTREPVCPRTAKSLLSDCLNAASVPERNERGMPTAVDSAAIALRGHIDPDDLRVIRGLLNIDPYSPGLWRARSTAGVALDPAEIELARSVWRDANAPWNGRVAAAAAAAEHQDAREFIEAFVDELIESYGDLTCAEILSWRFKLDTEEDRRRNLKVDRMKARLSGLRALADADDSFDVSAMLVRSLQTRNEAIQGVAMLVAANRNPELLVEGDHLAIAESEGLLRSRVLAARLHPELEERLLADVDASDAIRIRQDIESMGIGVAMSKYAAIYSY